MYINMYNICNIYSIYIYIYIYNIYIYIYILNSVEWENTSEYNKFPNQF